MQTYDAEFYPIEENRKKLSWIKPAGIIICVMLICLLALRVYGWKRDNKDTRLLVLINQWNSMEMSGYKPKLKEAENGLSLDKACIKDFKHMMADCRAAGGKPELISAYRDYETQERLFFAEQRRLEAMGENAGDAVKNVSRPGCSEHQLGLAADIVESSYNISDKNIKNTAAVSWLMENSWRYGFILRYPEAKEAKTGMNFQPWHYRYVGISAAELIHELDICLEEYIELFYSEAVIKTEK